ncbi:MAG: L-lysine 6-transaminase [Candidatus Krumholzibacteria bacterium]
MEEAVDGIGSPVENSIETIARHMLVDGFPMVIDLEKSQGCRLVDARSGRTYLDFFMFFASVPIGFNHPRVSEEDFVRRLGRVAVNKPSNSDFYTTYMADFVDACDKYAIPEYLPHMFLVSGGALGVENALKAAFDYKVRKNFAKGAAKETGTKVIHFRDSFHGRSGYTLSLTNTDPVKTDYFPKFDWPRITNPAITFPLENHMDEVVELENKAKEEIKEAIRRHGDDIAALIIEPIQGEGGDNHYRAEFFSFLREITEEHDIIFICDEVQTGVGFTGKFWAHEHMGIEPDAIAFGKKLQVCGVMASKKFDEVESVFKVSSRINSTWGGNLVDMVRATRYLEIIAEENLVENAHKLGEYLVASMKKVAERYPDLVTNMRGRGLMAAFDLPPDKRDAFREQAQKNGLIIVGCGPRSIRFRPPLNLTTAEADEGIDIIERSIKQVVA